MTEIATYLAGITTPQIAGVFGFLFYFGSFAAVQIGFLSGDGILFSLCNVIAASLVMFSLTVEFNLASALIQIGFFTIGIYGIAKRILRKPSQAPVVAQY